MGHNVKISRFLGGFGFLPNLTALPGAALEEQRWRNERLLSSCQSGWRETQGLLLLTQPGKTLRRGQSLRSVPGPVPRSGSARQAWVAVQVQATLVTLFTELWDERPCCPSSSIPGPMAVGCQLTSLESRVKRSPPRRKSRIR